MRAPSLTSRSDRLQQRLPITQHFGQVSPLTPSANAHSWNYHQVLLPIPCLQPDISTTPKWDAHTTSHLQSPPDSVAPEAPPPAPKYVLCRTGPFALGVVLAGDSGWKRNLLSPWKRGKTPRQGVGGWIVLEVGARTDGKVGPWTPDTSGQLVWGRNLRLPILTQDTLPEPRGCSGPVGRGSARRQLPGVWRRTGSAK